MEIAHKISSVAVGYKKAVGTVQVYIYSVVGVLIVGAILIATREYWAHRTALMLRNKVQNVMTGMNVNIDSLAKYLGDVYRYLQSQPQIEAFLEKVTDTIPLKRHVSLFNIDTATREQHVLSDDEGQSRTVNWANAPARSDSESSGDGASSRPLRPRRKRTSFRELMGKHRPFRQPTPGPPKRDLPMEPLQNMTGGYPGGYQLGSSGYPNIPQ